DIHRTHRALPPFPTRRSSDLSARTTAGLPTRRIPSGGRRRAAGAAPPSPLGAAARRKTWGWATRGGRSQASGGRTRERPPRVARSEEHTSELQSLTNLVCRLL